MQSSTRDPRFGDGGAILERLGFTVQDVGDVSGGRIDKHSNGISFGQEDMTSVLVTPINCSAFGLHPCERDVPRTLMDKPTLVYTDMWSTTRTPSPLHRASLTLAFGTPNSSPRKHGQKLPGAVGERHQRGR